MRRLSWDGDDQSANGIRAASLRSIRAFIDAFDGHG
jgi:hypothetical protein